MTVWLLLAAALVAWWMLRGWVRVAGEYARLGLPVLAGGVVALFVIVDVMPHLGGHG